MTTTTTREEKARVILYRLIENICNVRVNKNANFHTIYIMHEYLQRFGKQNERISNEIKHFLEFIHFAKLNILFSFYKIN